MADQGLGLGERRRMTEIGQAWFWTPQWQAMEREADADLAAGCYDEFQTLDDFIQSLRQEMNTTIEVAKNAKAMERRQARTG